MEKTYKFTLPQNKEVENTYVRVENGELLVNVGFKEKFQPKDGDFLVSSCGKVFIYNGLSTLMRYGAYCGVNSNNNIDICHPLSSGWTKKEGCRYATPEEKAAFLERLEKECHKRWNTEKKCLEDIRWRAKEGYQYWFVSTISAGISPKLECNSPFDDERYDNNNYFRTPEAAQKVADQIKDIFKSSKAE